MLLRVPEVLSPAELARCRAIVEGADWADGKITAGTQSEQVKNNRQLPEDAQASHAARAIVLDALGRSALFITGALPRKTYPPLFNRYDGASNAFGNHIDNSVRTSPITGAWVRTDLSATLFLSEPAEYDGGELVIEDTFGSQSVKLAAGDLILYPA
ncbi:MAG: Fe2+-dependent dioxygenase, partial [Oxalobacteraceae bacterium]